MKRHKLLLVSPCQGSYGGIEAFMLALADAARAEPDFEVKICFKKVKGFALHPDFAQMLQGQPANFVERGGGDLAQSVRWADIVHLQNASPDVVFLAKRFRKRLVLTIHNHLPRNLTLHHLLWRFGAQLADARWYNSNFVWKTWEGAHPRPGSQRVLTTSRLPEGWTAPEQRRGFLFVGRWIANKGIENLVDAYVQADLDCEAWPLILLGDGPLRGAIESRVQQRHLATVTMPGFVDENRKAEYMSRAKWIVAPPHTNEDLGLTPLEGRNLGVPCIVTRDGGLPEAGGAQALVCEPRDSAALARLLEQAARMEPADYARRAELTKAELKQQMVPLTFYPESYRKILAGESLGNK